MKQTIAIINFNTPELTEACILSIRKQGIDWPVVVFDNSADITAPAGTNGNDPKEDTIIKARPFRQKMRGVKVIDNTKGQVIDFEQFLSLYPDRNPQLGVYKSSVWGSAKHIMTVQKLWELLPDGFILVESDTLVKRDITELWKEQYSFCGYVQKNQQGNRFKVPRILPMLCYMNVPKLTKEGARYFDPDRCWGLKADANLRGNWFDTGACLLDDVLRMRPRLKGLHVDIRLFIEHYGGGSWHQGDLQRQSAWLKQHEALWAVNDTDKIEVQQPLVQSKDVAVCIIVRCENPYLREWCDHYLSLGVKKIFLYDNSREGDERPAEVLTGYGDAVEIIDYTAVGLGAQVQAYTDCYQKHGNDYGWIGFLDADELVKTDGYYSLPDYLDAMQADVVLLSWRIMTDSGLVHYEPRPMAERFTVAKENPSLENGTEFVKSFVRGGLTGLHFEVQPHVPSFKGKLKVVNAVGEESKLYPAIKPVHKVAWIDHYLTKTAEEYVGKINRGFANVSQEHNDKRKAHAIEDFFNINERTPEKEEILGVGKKKSRGKAASKPKTTKRTNSKK